MGLFHPPGELSSDLIINALIANAKIQSKKFGRKVVSHNLEITNAKMANTEVENTNDCQLTIFIGKRVELPRISFSVTS